MSSRHTMQNTDAIRVAALVGLASMALTVLLLVIHIVAFLMTGHGVVPPEAFAASCALSLVVPLFAALTIDQVRILLATRLASVPTIRVAGWLPAFFSVALALHSPPPRAAL